MTNKTTRVAVAERTTESRRDDLRDILEARRRNILNDLHGRIRDVRSDAVATPHGGRDQAEAGEANIQGDIEFALLEIKAETLTRIEEALSRLQEETYGLCLECGDEIAAPRLRALPFAVRCRDCEESREAARQRERIAARRGAFSLFNELQ